MNATKREEELRSTVIEILPELDEIGDEFLRSKVIDAWIYSLSNSSFNSIDEMRASGNADTPALKSGTQTDHIRGVTRIAMVIGDDMVKQFPELPINRDLLIACAICHDVGKPYEFDPENQKRWREDTVGGRLSRYQASAVWHPHLPDRRSTGGSLPCCRLPFR